ncbi:L-2-hydroxyglutarate oxidase [Lacimicrobium alkaliphilum]|uniref:Hydroxyglutarate oxidase n=1 Tax=Lacimicrobium alkaliphilum TaxID=1526571 RepID=A0ABQ1R0L8_9ALTE|nr:L-2-hydroxyglutarate oxidase [Lacimicrobium alkaliphilum]GGD53245.1 hydroxyglutarate oxidase [Lacimicrobium alkaliphilum]
MNGSKHFHLIIAGAGIIGAATAREYLLRYPSHRVLVVEKESQPAKHQSGRNSGVIHAGVYYQPASLKAKYCREGLEQTLSFCRRHQLPYLQCGKLIVATSAEQKQRLETLYRQCLDNDLNPQMLSAKELRKKEPAITGQAAMHVAQTGITDYALLTRTMLFQAAESGAEIVFNSEVSAITETGSGVSVLAGNQQYQAEKFINCSGLYADQLIRLQGIKTDFQIIPFRGEYFRLADKHNQLIRHLIYPVPDPALPFLGVHLTRMIDGGITLGPNAVLAMAKEGYSRSKVDIQELKQILTFRGCWLLLKRYWRSGLLELYSSINKQAYLRRVQAYCPEIRRADLLPYRSGVRAQAVNLKGELVHDFKFVQTDFTLHLGNAPSPAATSAMPIARAIVDKLS